MTPLIIAIGLYILSELLLFRFPSKSYVKYIPGLIGILGGAIFGYNQFTSFEELTEVITPLYLSFNLITLSLLVFVIMTMRKPWKKRLEDTEEDLPSEKVQESKIDGDMEEENTVMEESSSLEREQQENMEQNGGTEGEKHEPEETNTDSEKNN